MPIRADSLGWEIEKRQRAKLIVFFGAAGRTCKERSDGVAIVTNLFVNRVTVHGVPVNADWVHRKIATPTCCYFACVDRNSPF